MPRTELTAADLVGIIVWWKGIVYESMAERFAVTLRASLFSQKPGRSL